MMDAGELKKARTFISQYQGQAFPKVEAFLRKNGLVNQQDLYQLSTFTVLQTGEEMFEADVPLLTITSGEMGSLRNIRPTRSKVKSVDLEIKFGIKQEGFFSNATFVVKSTDASAKYCCFHFDTLYPSGHNTNRFAHPVHHFQFGGEKLSSFASSNAFYGQLLFVDTPRIPSPPMDLSLALHFIFTNFLPHDKYKIKESPDFEGLVKNAQGYFWAPFYRSVSAHWSNPTNSKFAKAYLPQIVG